VNWVIKTIKSRTERWRGCVAICGTEEKCLQSFDEKTRVKQSKFTTRA